MSQQDFDPYYHWLGIPPHEQPPNHYRLLGISLYETDARVIGNAADQRMLLLRSFQTGPNAMLTQPLMSQVEIARATLLTPTDRASYDRLLYSIAQQAYANQQAAYQQQLYQQAPPAVEPPPPPIAHHQGYAAPNVSYQAAEPPQYFQPTPEPIVSQAPQPTAEFYSEPRPTRTSSRGSASRQKGSEVSVIAQTIFGGLAGLAIAYGFITYVMPSLRGQRPVAQKTIQALPVRPSGQQANVVPNSPPPKVQPPTGGSGYVPPVTPDIGKASAKLASTATPEKPTIKPRAENVPPTEEILPQGESPQASSAPKTSDLPDNLPKFLKLPSTTSTEEAVLFSHAKLATDQIDFRLGTISGEPQIHVKLTEPNTWSLTAKSLDEDLPVAIGQIVVRGSDAHFAWLNLDRLSNLRSSLVNHFLHIDLQGKTHTAQFRKLVTQPIISLDLHKERSELEVPMVLPPPKETIWVRIQEVQCGQPTNFKDNKQEMPLGQDVAICWPQVPGPEMRIRCVATDDSLKIITSNRFIEVNDDSAAGIPWTFEHLTKTINSMDAKRTKALTEYNSIRNQQIPAAIRALQNVESSSPQSQPEALQRAQLLTKLQGDLKRLRMRGSSLEKQVPELEARLAAAPTLNSFMQSIDGNTSVALEVIARNGDNEIVLLSLTSVASDKPVSDTPAEDTPAFTRP